MKHAVAVLILLTGPLSAAAQDTMPVAVPKQICERNCQPVGARQVCNKHCWSYKGGPGSMLIQTTETWVAGPVVAAVKAKPKPKPVPVANAEEQPK